MNQINNSVIDSTAKLYKDVRIINSSVGRKCCIGDECDIENSLLEDKSELGRRNLIRNIKLGRGSYTGTNTVIKNSEIGRYTSIAWNVSVGGGKHNYKNMSMYTDYWYKRTFEIDVEPKEKSLPKITTVGNDVWIGVGAIINSEISIGDGSVIGAGAVITKDVPPYSIVVGVPGKVIKKRFDDEVIELLKEIKWWEWDDLEIKRIIPVLRSEPHINELRKFIDI